MIFRASFLILQTSLDAISFQKSKIVVNRIALDFDMKIANVSMIFRTPPDDVSSTSYNVTIDLFKVIDAMKVQMQVNFPESKNDTQYLRQLFKTSFNLNKLLKGVNGNSIIKSLIDGLLKTLNFKFEFPLQPGLYQVTNLTFQGRFFPPISTKFREEFITHVKVKGRRKMDFMSSIVLFGKLN